MRDVRLNSGFSPSALSMIVAVACLAAQAAGAQESAGGGYEFEGSVVAAREAEIAARVDGRLVSIDFTPGQIVRKGDLLFEFDTRLVQLSLDAAEARQQLMEAQLQLAEAKLRNARTLRERNVSPEVQLLEAQAQRDIAAASVDEARANVGVARQHLDETKLFAPIEGLISRPFVLEGAYITLDALETNRLAVVTQLDPIQVVGSVPFDTYLERRAMFDSREQVVEGLEYTLVLPTGESYPHLGRLVAGPGKFDERTQSMAVALEFPNPDLLLRPGLKVRLRAKPAAR